MGTDEDTTIAVILHDEDGSRCNEVADDVESDLDGAPMAQVATRRGHFDIINGFICGASPIWHLLGPDLLDPEAQASTLTVTDRETTFTFELYGIRQPPTLQLEGADPAAGWSFVTPDFCMGGPYELTR